MERMHWTAERHSLTRLIAERDGRILVGVGVSSGAEARQLHYTIHALYDAKAVPDYIAGFVTFVSGYLCAAQYGLPDLGYILRTEIVRQTDLIEQATWMAALDNGKAAFPIGVDVDTGYGNEPASILLTCRQVHKAGGQYVQIEDQYAINKSCGHMAGALGGGKPIISAEEMIDLRLRPAVSYAASQPDFLVMARTDARASGGMQEAARRAHRYEEAGAAFVFIEAPESEAELQRAADEFKGSRALSVANMIEGSPKTPYKSPCQLHGMGFGLALYCVGGLLAARAAQERYFEAIGRGGSAMDALGLTSGAWFAGFNRMIGREQTEAWNRFFHGAR